MRERHPAPRRMEANASWTLSVAGASRALGKDYHREIFVRTISTASVAVQKEACFGR